MSQWHRTSSFTEVGPPFPGSEFLDFFVLALEIVPTIACSKTAVPSSGSVGLAMKEIWKAWWGMHWPETEFLASELRSRRGSELLVIGAKQVEKEINLWAETETNGLIKELIEPGRLCGKPEPTFVLANALYFKGAWDDPFEPSSSDMNFHLLDGGTIRVPFLSGYHRYEYYGSFETFKVLRLPYGTGNDLDKRFSMYIFLPNRSNGLQDMIQEFNSDPGLFHKRTKLEKVDIAWLRIPKFKFSNTFTLSETMKELGLTLPFQMGGGPTGMVDWERVNCPNAQYMLKISMIIQKSFIEVNEDGTEAAACDEDDDMGFSLEPLPKPKPLYFDADHPFMFMIKEDISDIVFFTGAVLNPLEQN
ncbi:hypothetical protein Tsubulata_020286 [Turnera subulata]|uniref:Serpin domain-containing protein n=1 Tax=Turnera subulata TaxID=218843 RepID=A0A9Q0FDY7_9ROSI|nr:hypothetical protein Tsubulata_020286 [Turnera subulata]